MNSRIERDTLQTVGGTLLLFAVLIGFTETTLRSFAPLLGLLGVTLVYDVADDLYDLPDGTNWFMYGLGIISSGAVFAFTYSVWIGGLLTAAGAWFVLDGATKIRYGPASSTHNFVSESENDVFPKMLALNKVYRTLQNSNQPLTVEELAASCDLAEPRIDSALNYLEHRDQVVNTNEGYRAKPQKWGKATPLIRFLKWIPRRVVRPAKRVLQPASTQSN
jgi:hypothetical protein